MSEITLYFHIGAVKTGSTALQRFLSQNFSRLIDEFGVFYPNFSDKEVYSPMDPDGIYWQGHLFEDFDGSQDLDVINRCIQYCKEKSLRSIVVSHEALLINWCDRVGQLANRLDANIKIICYVRRQDHYLESAWKQVGHKFCASNEIMASLKDRDKWAGWYPANWFEKIEPWAAYFGEENIIIRPYEKEQMPNGIFQDFLKIINVTWPEEPRLRDESINVNRGLSRDALEFLYLNKDFYTDINDQRLYNMLSGLLSDNYKKKPFETYGILSPKERIELLNEYEPSNAMVARKYLHHQDGRLFFEPWPQPDDPWEPYEGLKVEKLTPIVTSMIYGLYEQQVMLAQKQQSLADRLTAMAQRDSFLRKIKRRLAKLFL